MSDYIANARTNAFVVKDLAALEADLAVYGLSISEEDWKSDMIVLKSRDPSKPNEIKLLSYGGWPPMDEDSVASRLGLDLDLDYGEHYDVPVPSEFDSLHQLIGSHLVEGQVAVFVEVGQEKMRYLGGTAVAVNAAGETRRVDLDDIYDLAKEIAPEGASIPHASY